jgi:hypothetical protein
LSVFVRVEKAILRIGNIAVDQISSEVCA